MFRPLTLGFISTWPIYQGTTIDRYAHSLIQGISAAAHETGCNLLLGCGFSVTGNSPKRPSFWPAPGPDVDFVPVGPWNTDGLIIVPDELTESQIRYVRDLQATGFPLIFTTPEGQRDMLRNVMSVVRAVEGGRGLGVFYWDATWTGVNGNGWDNTDLSTGNAWENQALFDFDGKALPALAEYLKP